MAASLQACGVVFPFAISTSICRSKFTICSGLYLFIGMTGLLQVNSLSFHLVQKSPVRSELQALPINQGVDDLVFDVKTNRLYAACPAGSGSIDVYKQTDADH